MKGNSPSVGHQYGRGIAPPPPPVLSTKHQNLVQKLLENNSKKQRSNSTMLNQTTGFGRKGAVHILEIQRSPSKLSGKVKVDSGQFDGKQYTSSHS